MTRVDNHALASWHCSPRGGLAASRMPRGVPGARSVQESRPCGVTGRSRRFVAGAKRSCKKEPPRWVRNTLARPGRVVRSSRMRSLTSSLARSSACSWLLAAVLVACSRAGAAAHAGLHAVPRSDRAQGGGRRLRQDAQAELSGVPRPRPRRLRLRRGDRGAPQPAGRPGLRAPGGLRARQSRGGLPDPGARHLAGQDGLHRPLLRAEGPRHPAASRICGARRSPSWIPASSSGYIYPMVLLIKQGLVRERDPKTFFKDALFAGRTRPRSRPCSTGGWTRRPRSTRRPSCT